VISIFVGCVAMLAVGLASLVGLRVAQHAAIARDGRLYRLVLPADFDNGALEQMLLSLHGVLRSPLNRLILGQPWLAVEVEGSSDGIELRLWTPSTISSVFLARHVEAAFPGVRVEPIVSEAVEWEARAHLTARGHGLIRLNTPTPGLTAVIAGLRGLGTGERVRFQLLAQPLSPGAQNRMVAEANRRLQDRRLDGERVRPSLTDRAEAQRLQAKAAVPLFATTIRIVASSPRPESAQMRVRAVASGLHQFGTAEVHLARHGVLFRRRFTDAVNTRRLQLIPAPTALNASELASLLKVTPALALEAGLPIARGRQLTPPTGVARDGRVLAVSASASGERPISLPIEEARRHLHVVGPTGVGKSTLLLNVALQDIEAGLGVVVLDPKGDLVDAILERLPKHREDDLIVFDPADLDWPVGMNMLELARSDEPELVTDHVVAVFRGIYERFWGPRTDDILKAALLTLLHEPGATLCEVPLLLTDDAFRARYLARLDDPVALEPFWGWYESLRPAARAEAIGPVSNKLRDFLLRRRLRNIVGQSKSTINFDEILRERKVLLVSLAKGLIGEEASALLGSFLIAKLWQATLARAGTPADQRPDTVVYVDEFQDYLRLPTSFEDVLAQARSFRLSLTLAHQHLWQLPPGLRSAVLANARSRAIFQCGAADARLLARELDPYLSEADLRALGPFEIALALSGGGNTGRPFTARTLPAPPAVRSSIEPLREASRHRYARPRGDVEAEIRTRLFPESPADPSFGRHRLSDRQTDRSAEGGGDAA